MRNRQVATHAHALNRADCPLYVPHDDQILETGTKYTYHLWGDQSSEGSEHILLEARVWASLRMIDFD